MYKVPFQSLHSSQHRLEGIDRFHCRTCFWYKYENRSNFCSIILHFGDLSSYSGGMNQYGDRTDIEKEKNTKISKKEKS